MEKKIQEQVTATWTVEINVSCPNCNDYFDIYNDVDSEDKPQPGEHVDFWNRQVQCPTCRESFTVDHLEY